MCVCVHTDTCRDAFLFYYLSIMSRNYDLHSIISKHEERKKVSVGAGGMTQWGRVLATKPNDQRSIPRTHTVEKEKSESVKLDSDLFTCAVACPNPSLLSMKNIHKMFKWMLIFSCLKKYQKKKEKEKHPSSQEMQSSVTVTESSISGLNWASLYNTV